MMCLPHVPFNCNLTVFFLICFLFVCFKFCKIDKCCIERVGTESGLMNILYRIWPEGQLERSVIVKWAPTSNKV